MCGLCQQRHGTQVKQLDAIIKVIGTPSDEDLDSVGCQNARTYVRTRLRDRPALDFKTMFAKPEGGSLSPEALDLLQRMLARGTDAPAGTEAPQAGRVLPSALAFSTVPGVHARCGRALCQR